MTLQILIATVNGRFFQRKYNPPFDACLVVNQIDGVAQSEPQKDDQTGVFDYHEKGLSKSRNRALQHANADVCLIADDDVTHLPAAKTIILDAFAQNPTADIITFQTTTPEGKSFKPYRKKPVWHTTRSIMSVTSFEIAFRTAAVASANLQFDERFGLGAEFPTGEENIFLLDALREGMKIRYIPTPIVVHPQASSGSNFHNSALIEAKGAMFYRMFGSRAYLVALLFAYKKYRLSDIGCWSFYRLMWQGMSKYKYVSSKS